MEQKPIIDLTYLITARGLVFASFGTGLFEGLLHATGASPSLEEVLLVCSMPVIASGVLRGTYFGLGLKGVFGQDVQKYVQDKTNILPTRSAPTYVAFTTGTTGAAISSLLAVGGYILGMSIYTLSSQ